MLSRDSVVAPHRDLLFAYLESADDVDVDVVRALLGTDADVNFRGSYGRTPLHICVQFARHPRCADVVALLLEAGAEVDARDVCGYTPLQAYLQHEFVQLAVVQTMLDWGAEVNTEGGLVFYDNVLSSFLASCGSLGGEAAIVLALLGAGANVNESDAYGMTPLHVYARNPAACADVLQMLLDAGADPRACDKYGVTPLATLLSSTAATETLVGLMLAAGADALALDADGRSMLHHLATAPRARESVVRCLLDLGCDPSAADVDGNTALHYMATYGSCSRAVVALLVERGLDIDRCNKRRQTALYRASVFNPGACKRLVQAGAALEPIAECGMCAVSEMLRRNDTLSFYAVVSRRPETALLTRALLAATNGDIARRTDAAIMCVHELVLRGAGAHVASDPALARYAATVAECETEIRELRAVQCHREATLLDVLRSSDHTKALFVPNAFLECTNEFPLYGKALFWKICMMRLRVSLADQVARMLCPCALPPELVAGVFAFMSYEELMNVRSGLVRGIFSYKS
ncbi:putative ankyrin repeat protein [Parapoxvirus red deer/HL953]|uniref:Putative ankyrin repeat protein n=1 Tax=Parapoxvirus red deer/HL953 TaxID=1579460 RepID=A0A0A7MA42_9POXV|nr:putative ankyrin repeat protein [Parapoxvirus red deer/HL953]AIZ77258.1 putative ankyrin repeat protein [Parapoxvirus red deer/HL953]